MTDEPLLQIRNLTKTFTVGKGQELVAVSNVSLDLREGETLGLVGESGSGKTTLGRVVLRLTEPDTGAIRFEGIDLLNLDGEPMRRMRSKMQIVYQDPMLGFNPRMRVRDIISEPLRLHETLSRTELQKRVMEVLELADLDPRVLNERPGAIRKAEQQQVAIARAIATGPRFIVLDEPTGLLDLSVSIHIIGILRRLQEEQKIAYIFISHDLSAVRAISHRLAIMYLGQLVETGPIEDVFARPTHPYSEALLSSVLLPDPKTTRQRLRLSGEIPSPIDLPPGCPLAPRCPLVEERCTSGPPPLVAIRGNGESGQPSWWSTCFPLSDNEENLDRWYDIMHEHESTETEELRAAIAAARAKNEG